MFTLRRAPQAEGTVPPGAMVLLQQASRVQDTDADGLSTLQPLLPRLTRGRGDLTRRLCPSGGPKALRSLQREQGCRDPLPLPASH